jgi:hypothetical protein
VLGPGAAPLIVWPQWWFANYPSLGYVGTLTGRGYRHAVPIRLQFALKVEELDTNSECPCPGQAEPV